MLKPQVKALELSMVVFTVRFKSREIDDMNCSMTSVLLSRHALQSNAPPPSTGILARWLMVYESTVTLHIKNLSLLAWSCKSL